jgi:hypothetical protein
MRNPTTERENLRWKVKQCIKGADSVDSWFAIAASRLGSSLGRTVIPTSRRRTTHSDGEALARQLQAEENQRVSGSHTTGTPRATIASNSGCVIS